MELCLRRQQHGQAGGALSGKVGPLGPALSPSPQPQPSSNSHQAPIWDRFWGVVPPAPAPPVRAGFSETASHSLPELPAPGMVGGGCPAAHLSSRGQLRDGSQQCQDPAPGWGPSIGGRCPGEQAAIGDWPLGITWPLFVINASPNHSVA